MVNELRSSKMLEYLKAIFLSEEFEMPMGVCSDGEVGFEIGDVWFIGRKIGSQGQGAGYARVE